MNRALGRQGTIFVTAFFSFATCIWQGVTDSWEHLFVARFVLGLGIGPKSATVPVYAAECTPPAIRGGLVMMWQMWTAFGIMLGYVADLAFYKVPDKPHITGLNWRLMLGSVSFSILLRFLSFHVSLLLSYIGGFPCFTSLCPGLSLSGKVRLEHLSYCYHDADGNLY